MSIENICWAPVFSPVRCSASSARLSSRISSSSLRCCMVRYAPLLTTSGLIQLNSHKKYRYRGAGVICSFEPANNFGNLTQCITVRGVPLLLCPKGIASQFLWVRTDTDVPVHEHYKFGFRFSNIGSRLINKARTPQKPACPNCLLCPAYNKKRNATIAHESFCGLLWG